MFGIESSNVVGYAPTSNGSAKAPIVGGQFFACNGGTTFNLADFKVPGTKEWSEEDGEWSCEYMTPGTEFIRVLDTTSLADTARYTYISEEFIIDNIGDLCEEENPDISEYAWAIGWWRCPLSGATPKYADIIEDGDKTSEYYIGDAPINFPNGTTFVGNFAKKPRQLVSSGAVAINTFSFSTASAKAPVFGNQLPVSIDLSDLSVPGTKEWSEEDGEWSCEYMTPGTEFIRVLDTTSLADVARYTYISEEFIIDNIGDLCEEEEPDLTPYAWAIGWWRCPLTGATPKYADIIEDDDKTSEYYLGNTAVPINAGYGFVGNFAKKVRNINFPSAINVPSKQ